MNKAYSLQGVKTNIYVYGILVEEPEGKRSLRRPNRTGRIILKCVLVVMWWCGMD
jgi:hypothetical protein